MPQRETRHFEVRVVPVGDGPEQDGLPRRFTARVLNYNRLDDYGTIFLPGCASEGLRQRLPRLLYGHAGWMDLASVLGRGVGYVDHPEGLDVTFEFDDFSFVPSARQIAAQMVSGTLDQFSIGFVRTAASYPVELDGITVEALPKIRIGESSVVIEGSVPDTGVLAFRARRANERVALIDANEVATIVTRFHLGELDLAEALTAVKAATIVEDGTKPGEPGAETAQEPADGADGTTAPGEGSEGGDGDPGAPGDEPEETLPDDEAEALLAELDETLDGLTSERPATTEGEAA